MDQYKEEHKALKELKEDKDRMVLTVDKGVVNVVMDRKEYVENVESLHNQPTEPLQQTPPINSRLG